MALISASEAKESFEKGTSVLVDVREVDEVSAMFVPGAIHMPLDHVRERLSELPRDREVHFLCRSGGRSKMACEKVADTLPHAKSIVGGIMAWKKNGGPVVVRSRMIPLMRQVQIVAALMILAGFAFKSLWFLVPIVGVGQLLAGVTGFCGMARLLEKMPWNRVASNEGILCQS